MLIEWLDNVGIKNILQRGIQDKDNAVDVNIARRGSGRFALDRPQ